MVHTMMQQAWCRPGVRRKHIPCAACLLHRRAHLICLLAMLANLVALVQLKLGVHQLRNTWSSACVRGQR